MMAVRPSYLLKWSFLPRNEVFRIAQFIREEEERNEGREGLRKREGKLPLIMDQDKWKSILHEAKAGYDLHGRDGVDE